MSSDGNRRGCWFAISKCFNSKPSDERNLYSKVSTENIEFEDLVTAEKKSIDIRKKKQVVTDLEKEHMMNGEYNELVEHQRRLDEERDAQLRRQEEALRREEEAYYTAKREAANKRAKKTKVPVSLEIEQADQSDVTFNYPTLPDPLKPSSTSLPPTTTVVVSGTSLMGRGAVGVYPARIVPSHQKEEDDFDLFLESVKVKQLSITKKNEPVSEEPVPELSDSEEEIDFGFWEKASMPTSSGSSTSERGQHGQTELPQEADLGLL